MIKNSLLKLYYASLYIENWIWNFRLWLSFNTRQPFNFVERKIIMRIFELVNDATWVNLMQLADNLEQTVKKVQPIQAQKKKKSSERLSKRELHNLMGMNRQIHKRVNGKVKRK